MLLVPGLAIAKTDFDGTWSDGPVPLLVDVSNAPAGSDDLAVLQQAAAAAAARWNGVIGRRFFQLRFVNGLAGVSANGVNEIYFSPALAGGPFFAAVAIERKASSSRRLESDVQLNPSHQWFYYHGPLRHEANGDRIPDLYRVLLHELGHMVGFLHAEPETSPSVMRAHMSDVDDFTAVDLRDAKKAVAFLFQKNAPRFVWPPHFRIEVPDSRVVLRGHGRPFFIRVATVRIFSATGQRRRHLLIGRVWSKPLHLEQGWNQLRFFYRLPDRSTARFATRFIRVR